MGDPGSGQGVDKGSFPTAFMNEKRSGVNKDVEMNFLMESMRGYQILKHEHKVCFRFIFLEKKARKRSPLLFKETTHGLMVETPLTTHYSMSLY